MGPRNEALSSSSETSLSLRVVVSLPCRKVIRDRFQPRAPSASLTLVLPRRWIALSAPAIVGRQSTMNSKSPNGRSLQRTPLPPAHWRTQSFANHLSAAPSAFHPLKSTPL